MELTKYVWLWAIAMLLNHQPCHAVCSCPTVCENCHRTGDFKLEFGRQSCNDIESQAECEKANWEISDMQSSVASLVDHFLDNALETQEMGIMQVGFARSLLSLAMEDVKPEGDCANGLNTETGVKGTLTHCYSPELLEQCAKVRDAVDDYQTGMAQRMSDYFLNNSLTYTDGGQTYLDRSVELGLVSLSIEPGSAIFTSQPLQDLIEIVRFRTRIKTARIRCAYYDDAGPIIVDAAYHRVTGTVFWTAVALAAIFVV